MKITPELIQHLCKLSQLEVAPHEREILREDLEKMVLFVEQLHQIDVKGIPPLQHMSGEAMALRNDEVREMVNRELALQNAPAASAHFFAVPKVISQPANE
ncbi:MAG: Asp-tRNA(Asn)/Glu-tRNA(Gln) amidotransferase subunit GatC [Chitinophagia bacterium]|jgi:aspartyl/glutamyl-tRNA(Asn/Gln) amidotransferase C subunit